MDLDVTNDESLRGQIRKLEAALNQAHAQLHGAKSSPPTMEEGQADEGDHVNVTKKPLLPGKGTFPHFLLLLSDSALPLGSFAFSSGLESYIAHHRPRPAFPPFLALSITSVASTTLPYILAAFHDPQRLETLDNDLDASTPCTVARRASTAQGRALLGVWERAFRHASSGLSTTGSGVEALDAFSASLKSSSSSQSEYPPNGHFAPIWGIVCLSLGLSVRDAVYIFLFNHAKAVLSAAVRASVMGPYQAQGLLASEWLQAEIREATERNWGVETEEAGQAVPVLDLWVGRHELLYSRIFNS